MRRFIRTATTAAACMAISSTALAQHHPHERLSGIQAVGRFLGVGMSPGNFAKPVPKHQVLPLGTNIGSGSGWHGHAMPAAHPHGNHPTSGYANPAYGNPAIHSPDYVAPHTVGQPGDWANGVTLGPDVTMPSNSYPQMPGYPLGPNNSQIPNSMAPGSNLQSIPGGSSNVLPQKTPTPAPNLSPSKMAPVEPPPPPAPTWLKPYLKDEPVSGKSELGQPELPKPKTAEPDLGDDLLAPAPIEEPSPSDRLLPPPSSKPIVPQDTVPKSPGNVAPVPIAPVPLGPVPEEPSLKEPKPSTPPKAAPADDDDSLIQLTPQPRLRAAKYQNYNAPLKR